MIVKNYFNRFRFLTMILFVCAATTLGAGTAETKDVSSLSAGGAKLSAREVYSIAEKVLTKKMETDLVLNGVKVKFSKVESYTLPNSTIGLRGEGNCQLGAEDNPLPIHFDVKINAANRSATEVNYNFVEASETNESAMSEVETVVTHSLMEKIKADYKVENIVIALDYVNEASSSVSTEKTLTGAGEIRLGDMVWKKITFDVIVDNQNTSAAKVKYQIQ